MISMIEPRLWLAVGALAQRWSVMTRMLVLSAFVLPFAGAAERRVKPAAPAIIPDLPTMMTQRSKVLVNESFSNDTWTKLLKSGKTDLLLGDGALRIAPQEGAGHAPQISHYARVTDVVIQVRFQLDGAKWMNVQVADNKTPENLAAVGVDPRRITLSSITGWGRTTRYTTVRSTPFVGDPAGWHTLLVEWCGNECLVRFDDKLILHGEAIHFGLPKGQLSFNSSGGGVRYDDVRIWEAVPDPAWAKRKGEVLKTLPR